MDANLTVLVQVTEVDVALDSASTTVEVAAAAVEAVVVPSPVELVVQVPQTTVAASIGGDGPPGPTGPTGPVGPTGPAGVAVTEVYDAATVPPTPGFPYVRFARDGAGDVQTIYLGTTT